MSKKQKKRKQQQKPQKKKKIRSSSSSGASGKSGSPGSSSGSSASGGSSGGGTMMKLRGGFQGVVRGGEKKAKSPFSRAIDILFWVALAAILAFILYSRFFKSGS